MGSALKLQIRFPRFCARAFPWQGALIGSVVPVPTVPRRSNMLFNAEAQRSQR